MTMSSSIEKPSPAEGSPALGEFLDLLTSASRASESGQDTAPSAAPEVSGRDANSGSEGQKDGSHSRQTSQSAATSGTSSSAATPQIPGRGTAATSQMIPVEAALPGNTSVQPGHVLVQGSQQHDQTGATQQSADFRGNSSAKGSGIPGSKQTDGHKADATGQQGGSQSAANASQAPIQNLVTVPVAQAEPAAQIVGSQAASQPSAGQAIAQIAVPQMSEPSTQSGVVAQSGQNQAASQSNQLQGLAQIAPPQVAEPSTQPEAIAQFAQPHAAKQSAQAQAATQGTGTSTGSVPAGSTDRGAAFAQAAASKSDSAPQNAIGQAAASTERAATIDALALPMGTAATTSSSSNAGFPAIQDASAAGTQAAGSKGSVGAEVPAKHTDVAQQQSAAPAASSVAAATLPKGIVPAQSASSNGPNGTTSQIANGSAGPDGRSNALQSAGQKSGTGSNGAGAGNAQSHDASTNTQVAAQHTVTAQASAAFTASQQSQMVAQSNSAAPVSAADHGNAPLPSSGSGTNAPASAQQLPQTHEALAGSGINTASLLRTMSETEMRVVFQSPDFGGIAIRTTVQQQQLVAQISVDHSGLAGAISAHIPAMESHLNGNLGLRAAIEVTGNGASFAGGQNGSSQGDARGGSTPARTDNVVAPITAERESPLHWTAPATDEAYRLDIRV